MIDSEKCRFLLDLESVVLRFEHSAILDTCFMREERPRIANRYVSIFLTMRTKPALFANRCWDWPGPHLYKRYKYPMVAAECLRLRLEYDASKLPGQRAREELYQLTRRPLSEAAVDPRAGIVPVPLDEITYRRASIVSLTDPHLDKLAPLCRNLGFVVSNHAAISGRSVANEEDYAVERYMLRHTVPIWAERILRVLIERGARAIGASELIRLTGLASAWQWHYGGVNPSRPPEVGDKIIEQLFLKGPRRAKSAEELLDQAAVCGRSCRRANELP